MFVCKALDLCQSLAPSFLGGTVMTYSFIPVSGHIEVYDENGKFLFSADTRQEAWQEMEAELA